MFITNRKEKKQISKYLIVNRSTESESTNLGAFTLALNRSAFWEFLYKRGQCSLALMEHVLSNKPMARGGKAVNN